MSHDKGKVRKQLDEAVAAILEQGDGTNPPGVRNPVFEIWSPGRGFRHSVTMGAARADSDAPMTPDHQFHIASIGKTMTAAIILQLWEEGLLGDEGLDLPLAELGALPAAAISKLHVLNGVSYGEKITIRQMLNHSSGLKDAHIDDANGVAADYGGPAPGSLLIGFIEASQKLAADVGGSETEAAFKSWVPWDPQRPDDPQAGIVNYYLNQVAHAPVGPPGEQYHYSDTAYVILGLVIERITGQSLHSQLRKRIFDPLGLGHTYLAYATDPDCAKWEFDLADFYLGPLAAVTAGVNMSFDWAGGGEVSTAGDLNQFLYGLLSGKLFQRAETLEEMTRWTALPGSAKPTLGFGLGIYCNRYSSGIEIRGHGGAWGGMMFYEPASDTYISGSVNQVIGVPPLWQETLFQALRSS
jgi:D-alanyl-D-alanine carboxypeptidase